MLRQIKKVAAKKRVTTKKKSCITRQATWKLTGNYFWNYNGFIRCGNCERFCFSYSLGAFASEYHTIMHYGIV